MKKSTLALSIAAAIGGLGMAGNALAVTDVLSGAGAGSVMARNDGGIGHQLVFPYFTAQGTNATLLTITNTDTTNGKLVKVRFRGATNSDDLYDFQIAMSPGDVWTASVTKDATTGAATLATTDKSCTVPFVINGNFKTDRVKDLSVANTLEGYAEVINMADIRPVTASGSPTTYTSALFTAIKHVNGVAPCTAAILTDKLGQDNTYAQLIANNANGSTGIGLAAPTTGLTGDWIILDQAKTAAWSGSATALEVRASGVATTGDVVFWPQLTGTPSAVTASTTGSPTGLDLLTADPLMTSGIVSIQNYDLPDLSTAYSATATSAAIQADQSTSQLAVTSVANQYVTDAGIAAVTDLLFSQPFRRYSVAVNYKSTSSTNSSTGVVTAYPLNTSGAIPSAIYRGAVAGGGTAGTTRADTANTTARLGAGSAYYASGNMSLNATSGALCLSSISAPGRNTIFDREETTPASGTTSFVISPGTPTSAASTPICGEAAVVSINNGGTTGASALGATLARTDFTSTSLTTYANGWVYFATPSVGTPTTAMTASTAGPAGLPIIGQSFIRIANGAVNYGVGYANKVTR